MDQWQLGGIADEHCVGGNSVVEKGSSDALRQASDDLSYKRHFWFKKSPDGGSTNSWLNWSLKNPQI